MDLWAGGSLRLVVPHVEGSLPAGLGGYGLVEFGSRDELFEHVAASGLVDAAQRWNPGLGRADAVSSAVGMVLAANGYDELRVQNAGVSDRLLAPQPGDLWAALSVAHAPDIPNEVIAKTLDGYFAPDPQQRAREQRAGLAQLREQGSQVAPDLQQGSPREFV